MPKGYFFVEVEIADSAAYDAYHTAVPDIISAHGSRILVGGGDSQLFDGIVPHSCRVIVGFDADRCRDATTLVRQRHRNRRLLSW